MSGRLEHEDHLTNVCLEGLEEYPQILKSYFKESAGKQKTTKVTYVNTMKRFVDYLDGQRIDVDDINGWKLVTRRHCKDFFHFVSIKKYVDGRTKKLSTESIMNYWKAVNKFFTYLVKEGIIEKNPCPDKDDMEEMFTPQNVEFHPVAMTNSEVGTVRQSIKAVSKMPRRDDCIFIVGCRYGIRAEALSEIDISDIDFEAKAMTVTDKGNYTREVLLDDDTIRLINECIEERTEFIHENGNPGTDALFIRKYQGRVCRVSKVTIAKMLEKSTTDIDKHITPHKMRSTCITLTYEATGDIYDASRRGGHHSVVMTQRYIDAREKDRKLADTMACVIG